LSTSSQIERVESALMIRRTQTLAAISRKRF